MYEERANNKGEDRGRDRERAARRRHRIGMAREVFNADLILDAGPCAIGIDRGILDFLHREGLRPDADKRLEDLLRPIKWQGSSFLNYLGLGCLFYDELDGEMQGATT
jgi:hypothetical protein